MKAFLKWWCHVINSLPTGLLARSIHGPHKLGPKEKWGIVFSCIESVIR